MRIRTLTTWNWRKASNPSAATNLPPPPLLHPHPTPKRIQKLQIWISTANNRWHSATLTQKKNNQNEKKKNSIEIPINLPVATARRSRADATWMKLFIVLTGVFCLLLFFCPLYLFVLNQWRTNWVSDNETKKKNKKTPTKISGSIQTLMDVKERCYSFSERHLNEVGGR